MKYLLSPTYQTQTLPNQNTTKESDAGQPCTTPAELCGSDRACDLHVVTSPFKQYGATSSAKRSCIVKAGVAIGILVVVGKGVADKEWHPT